MKNKVFKRNMTDAERNSWSKGESVAHERMRVIPDKAINKLYCDVYEIPPGKSNWPSHFHTCNEELFFILDGEGEVIARDEVIQIRPGDIIRFPAGEQGTHQLKNTSACKVLRYLDLGTTNLPDVVFMPDENKIELFDEDKDKMWKYSDID